MRVFHFADRKVEHILFDPGVVQVGQDGAIARPGREQALRGVPPGRPKTEMPGELGLHAVYGCVDDIHHPAEVVRVAAEQGQPRPQVFQLEEGGPAGHHILHLGIKNRCQGVGQVFLGFVVLEMNVIGQVDRSRAHAAPHRFPGIALGKLVQVGQA